MPGEFTDEGRTTARGGVVRVFAALGDPARVRILEALAERPTTATRLAGPLGMSRQAVVKHLGILTDAGLIVGERAGREVVFRPVSGAADGAQAWLAGLGAAWERRLAAIKRAAENA